MAARRKGAVRNRERRMRVESGFVFIFFGPVWTGGVGGCSKGEFGIGDFRFQMANREGRSSKLKE